MARLVEQRDPSALPAGTAVCLGAFDGLHLGHQALLDEARSRGERIGLVTFDPHPQQVLAPARAPKLLHSPSQRRRVCATLGVEHLVLLPFDKEMAQMQAETFARTMIVEGLRPAAIVVGEDFRFGRGREGDGEMLAALVKPAGIEVVRVTAVPVPDSARGTHHDPSFKLGATAIRRAIELGHVAQAGAMLGRWHGVEGTVVHGAHRGHAIGFPTANIRTSADLVPPPGVYATMLAVTSPEGPHAGKVWPAATNLGRNPTFTDSGEMSLEAHVIDQELGDTLYDLDVELSFVARLRDEQRFDGPTALVAQLQQDVQAASARLDSDALARVVPPIEP
ncbi:MAG: riboflavin biosynthesis protein RibF [Myxococcota bacterium]